MFTGMETLELPESVKTDDLQPDTKRTEWGWEFGSMDHLNNASILADFSF